MFKATWWRQKTPGTTYWRCELPARFLPGQVLPLGERDVQPDPVFPEQMKVFPRQRGAAIWQFPGNATRGLMMAGMQEHGIPVLMESDDNYTIPGESIPGMADWKIQIDRKNDEHSNEAHARIAQFADGIITSTERLAQTYRKLNDKVFVCANAVDPADWQPTARPRAGGSPFRIAYAASHSHYYDIGLVQRALGWAAHQPDVEVVVYGLDPGWLFPYTKVEWEYDLATYRQSLFGIDVGLCPLKPKTWALCRGDVKAMEYAMVGALPVVSELDPYKPWFDQPCLKATTEKDFLKAVKWAVKNRDEVKRLAAEAKSYVLAERSMDKNVWRWEEAIDECSRDRKRRYQERCDSEAVGTGLARRPGEEAAA